MELLFGMVWIGCAVTLQRDLHCRMHWPCEHVIKRRVRTKTVSRTQSSKESPSINNYYSKTCTAMHSAGERGESSRVES